MKIHPRFERMQQLLEGLHPEVRKVLRHAVECDRCRETFAGLLAAGEPVASPEVLEWRPRNTGYTALMDRFIQSFSNHAAAAQAESQEARALLAELLELPREERTAAIDREERWRRLKVGELLLEQSKERRLERPKEAEELALLAVYLGERLTPEDYTRPLIADLLARGWTGVGVARRRLQVDLRAAEEAFDLAEAFQAEGTNDLLDRALLLESKALLRKDQRRLEEASRLLERAISQFSTAGDDLAAARATMNLATVWMQDGRPEESIDLLRRVAHQVSPDDDPRLALGISHNLVFYLTEAGRYLEAQAVAARARRLYDRFPETWTQLRRRWAEAKIARGTGRSQEAETAFLEVRDGFIEEGAGYDAALISLELATLYAEEGRSAETRRLAAEMLPIFSAQDIHREAMAALLIFRKAALEETLTLDLVNRIARFMVQARHDPQLKLAEMGLDDAGAEPSGGYGETRIFSKGGS